MQGLTDMNTLASIMCLCLALYLVRHRQRKGLALPPGPRGVPLLGNVLQINPKKIWRELEIWGKQYGNSYSVSVELSLSLTP